MSSTTDKYLLLSAFAEELARCGMRAACTSPGSRNAPLVLSLARERRLRCYSHIDERCAGFFALGLAKASGLPVAVTCTSGTAAAELLPAAIEAQQARVPLLLLSADRPPELRENGAGQAIDQLKLLGGAAKWFFEVGVEDAGPDGLRWIRTLACRAYWTSLEDRPGVVHLNFPLREPLVDEEPLPRDDSARPGQTPFVSRPPRGPGASSAPKRLATLLGGTRRGVVVAGRWERPDLGPAAAAFAEAAGWPLLADPLSGARRGGAAIAHYDALLRDQAFASSATPDVVLRVGDLPVSKPLRSWLAGLAGVAQIALDPEGAWQDPASVLSHSLNCDPADTLAELARRPGSGGDPAAWTAEPDWPAMWRSADELAAEAILGVVDGAGLSEPAVASELGVLLPEQATLFVASSMPVRDIETFWPVREDPPRVLCNRGANGIDGIVSSAFGVAAHAAGPEGGGGPVVLLIGDVALAHDIGGLLAASRLGVRLTIVLINNGGGGIFDFLPVSGASMALEKEASTAGAGAPADIYTRHIASPSGLDFPSACTLYGLEHHRAGDALTLRAALETALAGKGSSLIEVQGSREHNVALHRDIWRAVARALER